MSPTVSLFLAILLLLRHSFQWVDGFSLTGLSVSKVEKTVEWPIVTSLLQPQERCRHVFYAKKVVSSLCDKSVKKGLFNFTATYVKLISIGFWK